jgi:hypothetical protein
MNPTCYFGPWKHGKYFPIIWSCTNSELPAFTFLTYFHLDFSLPSVCCRFIFSEEEKLSKRAIELNNGRAAQIEILGLMVHELIIPLGYDPDLQII